MFLIWEFPLCKRATVTAGIGSGSVLARVTAALGGRDLATVIRSHKDEERGGDEDFWSTLSLLLVSQLKFNHISIFSRKVSFGPSLW